MQKKEIYQEISKKANVIVEYIVIKESAEQSNLDLIKNKGKFDNLPSLILETLENNVNEMLIKQMNELIITEDKILYNLFKELKKI